MPQAPLAAKKAKRRLAVSQGNARLEGHRYMPDKGSNSVSRDVTADACGASGRPANPGREAWPRLD